VRRVLIANRGEIAVRVARACRDAGLTSLAVYSDPDRDAVHVRLADEAYALGGDSPASSYLDIGKILGVARAAAADAVHPGYGFLAENAEFAQAVLGAGLTWIGPPPNAIRALGDKVTARHIARGVGARLVAGTHKPASGVGEIIEFARANGLPIAIKAAYGGGGRGMKVARTLAEVAEQFASAEREAMTAFGRRECFAERYLDRPRHVETQCLADTHGNVVVVSTRDCSLQRRHQKLVEEAPAPFLTGEQAAELRETSRAIMREAGYIGAGTCEFLVGEDGMISFLEVNTRLQVEHPVTEEVTAVDLVREMFRIADGQQLGYQDPAPRGHSIEFRINCEDPGRNFLPVPGALTRYSAPSGPGVRVDGGVQAGTVIGPAWDSLLAKLIVTGATRTQALERARRALAEFDIQGVPTVLPLHRALVIDPAFTDEPFRVHTRWLETEFTGVIAPQDPPGTAGGQDESAAREIIVVEVGGRRLDVSVPVSLGAPAAAGAAGLARSGAAKPAGGRTGGRSGPGRAGANRAGANKGSAGGPGGTAAATSLCCPMQGTIVKVAVGEGQSVSEGDLVVVLEAMKMEQPVHAHRGGTVRDLRVAAGAAVSTGMPICDIDG
jgi:acetyl-CoA/propionyl-CoA/long-chain acyl-CoA carboxylase, biotin carboxylase, biotin carboxyl carrier protein